MDLPGIAIADFFRGEAKAGLWIYNSYGEKEKMLPEIYFRDEAEMSEIELTALKNCKGKILDIGAAAGSHALILQERGKDVTALDISAASCDVMKKRGVEKILQQDIFTFSNGRFDTLLMLMNGIGICGTTEGLKKALIHFERLLNGGGQLLFDSSDISYIYEGEIRKKPYYGQIQYSYSYKRKKTEPFNWLYIDRKTLIKIAKPLGWKSEILMEDDFDQYLVRLTK